MTANPQNSESWARNSEGTCSGVPPERNVPFPRIEKDWRANSVRPKEVRGRAGGGSGADRLGTADPAGTEFQQESGSAFRTSSESQAVPLRGSRFKQAQFGIVLAGGGAKGAYQVGAVSYLAELGIEPQIIAGTSIGALNGGVLASNGSFKQAARRLAQVWDKLGTIGIIRSRLRSSLTEADIPTLQQRLVNLQAQLELQALFDPEPIEEVLKEAIDLDALRNGTEFWVTVFPTLKLWIGSTLVDVVRARTGTNAHWLCAQDCPDEEIYNLLLASAAIPIAFPCRNINGQGFVDGGLADNVPLKPLAARGCTHAIVIHLGNGAAWSRHSFPGQTVIEIRPEKPIQKSNTPVVGLAEAFFDFSTQRIAELKQRGYNDAKCCMEPVIHTFISVKEQRRSHHRLLDSTQMLLDDLPL